MGSGHINLLYSQIVENEVLKTFPAEIIVAIDVRNPPEHPLTIGSILGFHPLIVATKPCKNPLTLGRDGTLHSR